MTNDNLPNILVLRCDTATGFFRVGWDSDMPIGRFSHAEVVCETLSSEPITPKSPYFSAYVAACNKARVLNEAKLEQQRLDLITKGWIIVPLNLDSDDDLPEPDPFGGMQNQAMSTMHRLCENKTRVWAVITEDGIVNVRPCEPPRKMEAVEYQVWLNDQTQRMKAFRGDIIKGKLVVQESGLWFCPEKLE